jgi:hypothetical protein
MASRLRREIGLMGLVTLALVGSGLGFTAASRAQPLPPTNTIKATESTPPDQPIPETEAETEAVPALPSSFDRYTYEALFSVGVPNGWQTTEQALSPQLTFSNADGITPEVGEVRTEITWFDQPPGVVVPQVLDDIKQNGYRVARYEPQEIDGTTALSVWLADLPEALSNAYMTYIGYEDSTAAVVTYYATDSGPEIESVLSTIHGSFQRLE